MVSKRRGEYDPWVQGVRSYRFSNIGYSCTFHLVSPGDHHQAERNLDDIDIVKRLLRVTV